MKYYLIVGEASGDLHASNLMHAIKQLDKAADFRFFGGDLMLQEGGTRVAHYRDMAYMGLVPVLLHLRTIFTNMKRCKQDILTYQPDVLLLVDYPGFNLSIAKYIKKNSNIPVFYYISPKIWAWKEHRIKNIKRDVDELFSILPFEVDFYKKHQYPIHYVGNPCADAVRNFSAATPFSREEFIAKHQLSNQPIIALLAGSRKQEIAGNLQLMLETTVVFEEYQVVIAAAPGIDLSFYDPFIRDKQVKIVVDQTYDLLRYSAAALVTSGTATLETALFRVPQIVCYHTSAAKFVAYMRKLFLKVKYVSLVNLIAGREVVRELVADEMTVENLKAELDLILYDKVHLQQMLDGYDGIISLLGHESASQKAAKKICALLPNYLSKKE